MHSRAEPWSEARALPRGTKGRGAVVVRFSGSQCRPRMLAQRPRLAGTVEGSTACGRRAVEKVKGGRKKKGELPRKCVPRAALRSASLFASSPQQQRCGCRASEPAPRLASLSPVCPASSAAAGAFHREYVPETVLRLSRVSVSVSGAAQRPAGFTASAPRKQCCGCRASA